MCQLCGQARASRRDAQGREICNKMAHRAGTLDERKKVTKLQTYAREKENDGNSDKDFLTAVKGAIRKLAGGA